MLQAYVPNISAIFRHMLQQVFHVASVFMFQVLDGMTGVMWRTSAGGGASVI
jgi:hypothetical protein